jgi:hypothetical protein
MLSPVMQHIIIIADKINDVIAGHISSQDEYYIFYLLLHITGHERGQVQQHIRKGLINSNIVKPST